jgi:phosphoglycolate phosphatase-like HAD superfamily hydrolase
MKLFVWDFHGVLEKGNEGAVLEISNQVLRDFGYQEQFSVQENHRLYGCKWYQYFEHILPHEPHERHLELQLASFTMSDTHPDIISKHVDANDHALAMLRSISSKYDQIVISNTKPSSLELFIKATGMTDYFNSSNAFAVDIHKRDAQRTKLHVLSKYLLRHPADQIVAIGDSPADMLLATPPTGVRYLYSHPGRQFKDCQADYRITDLRELLREL